MTQRQQIIAIANQKGGVGKTTTAVNLAASLAAAERPTLLVDLDPQGNASSGVGVPPGTVEKTIYDALIGNAPLREVIRSYRDPDPRPRTRDARSDGRRIRAVRNDSARHAPARDPARARRREVRLHHHRLAAVARCPDA